MMPRQPATFGDALICSIGTSLRNCAFGFFAPLAWFFHAMREITSLSVASSTPYFLAYAGASSENVAGARHARRRCRRSGGCMSTRPE